MHPRGDGAPLGRPGRSEMGPSGERADKAKPGEIETGWSRRQEDFEVCAPLVIKPKRGPTSDSGQRAVETSEGHFTFPDTQATNFPRRFYRVSAP
jgi:hypothetical protein